MRRPENHLSRWQPEVLRVDQHDILGILLAQGGAVLPGEGGIGAHSDEVGPHSLELQLLPAVHCAPSVTGRDDFLP